MRSKYLRYVFVGLFLVIFFIVAAQVSQVYSTSLQEFVFAIGIFAPLLYIFINIVATVLAPLSSAFLIPMAANSFGPLLTAIYSVAGWFIGSVIAFYLAREYGYGKVKNSHISKRIQTIEEEIPQGRKVLVMVLLRLSLPVDVLSYAFGLLTNVSYKTFIWTTLVGITPFAIMFSYASVLSVEYQVGVTILCGMAFISAVFFLFAHKKKKG